MTPLLWGCLLGGCAAVSPDGDRMPGADAGEPDPRGPGVVYGRDAGAFDQSGDPDAPDGEVEKPSLQIHELPGVTYWDSLPISGQGPAGGYVRVETPRRGEVSADISSSGTFCVDVPLEPETANELVFRAIDARGRHSDPLTAEVRQEGSPPEPTEVTPQEPTNAALGATVERMSVTIEQGTAEALTDGNEGTYALLQNSTWDDDWIILALAERTNLERIRVLTTTDCVMDEYKVMLSDAPAPSDAVDGNPGWELVEHVGPANTLADMSIALEPTAARYIGIQFLSRDCNRFYHRFLGEHRIREIEAWTAPMEQAPSRNREAESPTCLSGGLL